MKNDKHKNQLLNPPLVRGRHLKNVKLVTKDIINIISRLLHNYNAFLQIKQYLIQLDFMNTECESKARLGERGDKRSMTNRPSTWQGGGDY